MSKHGTRLEQFPILTTLSFLGALLCLFLSGLINIVEFGVFSLIMLIIAALMKFIKSKIKGKKNREIKIENDKSNPTDFSRSHQELTRSSPERNMPNYFIEKNSPAVRKISSPTRNKQLNINREVPHHFEGKKNQKNKNYEYRSQRLKQSDGIKYGDKNTYKAKYDYKKLKETKYEFKNSKATRYEEKESKETKYDYKSPKATRHEEKESKETKYDYKSPKATRHEEKKIEATKTDDKQLFIIIAFENSKQYYPLRKTVKLNTTINEIKKNVVDEYDIKDEIVIKYKKDDRTIPIEETKTISDIKDLIKEKESNGKYNHYLYVEISKKDSITKSLPPKRVKVKKPTLVPIFEDHNDDENATSQTKSLVSTSKTKRKISPRNCLPKVTKYIESSEPEEPHKKSVKTVKPAEKSSPGKEVKTSTSGSKKIKYLYQTNKDKTVKEIELDSEATVKTMRSELAKIHNVRDAKNVKILFSGKDLTDEIRLKSLKIGNIILFIYIRSEEDILLLTAKALKV